MLLLTRRPSLMNVGARKSGREGAVVAVMQDRTINLTFHGIGQADRRVDPDEQDVWVESDQFLALLDRAAGRDDVSIMFDDGNASDVEHALPALQARGMRGTFFIVAGRLETPGFVDADAVRELADAGMEIGCHGMRHRPWRGLDRRALQEELVEAKAILEGVLGRPVTRAACPFGSYDRRALRTLRCAGYLHVYTSDRGTARPSEWLQARNTIRPADTTGVIDRIGTDDGLRRRLKRAVKRWH